MQEWISSIIRDVKDEKAHRELKAAVKNGERPASLVTIRNVFNDLYDVITADADEINAALYGEGVIIVGRAEKLIDELHFVVKCETLRYFVTLRVIPNDIECKLEYKLSYNGNYTTANLGADRFCVVVADNNILCVEGKSIIRTTPHSISQRLLTALVKTYELSPSIASHAAVSARCF